MTTPHEVLPPPDRSAASDFFDSHEGTALPLPKQWWRRAELHARDLSCELRVRVGAGLREVRSIAASKTLSRVLIVGIEVPARAADIHDTVARLSAGSRHRVTVSIVPMLDRGKFANIEAAIAAASSPLDTFDWLVIADDDIAFRPGFLDDLIAISAAADLALSQPCHALFSHTTYELTRRRFGALARRTNFVEIGPLTLVRADLFSVLVPFPPSRWCYGIDLVWSVETRRAGCKMGIVDGVPIRHLRPVAATYDMDAARAEGQALIVAHRITESRAQFFGVDEVVLVA